MKLILILGAGRSSNSLINYLEQQASDNDWIVRVGDRAVEEVRKKFDPFEKTQFFKIDIDDEEALDHEISQAHVVISMLPADFHYKVAVRCLKYGKHLLTASYVTDEIKELSTAFAEKGCMLVMEAGLDPGIDHMSGMKVLDRIRNNGFELTSFETFTGGLVAPSKENNPWQYKFTWNPEKVVLAGQGTVKFIQEGRFKYIPYHRLFRRAEVIHIPNHGYFEGYANRDSLKYLDSYDLHGIRTLFRGTLRRPGFCKSWNVFVQLGATDNTYAMENVQNLTHRQFINSFLYYNPYDSVELKLAHYMNLDMESEEMYRLKWLGIFDDEPVGLERGTPAQILEHILKKKWILKPDEKDMIVMWHKFDYLDGDQPHQIQSSMVVFGEDKIHTGMSKAVGLPLAIICKLILHEQLAINGLHIPTKTEIYMPVLAELESYGFEFEDHEVGI